MERKRGLGWAGQLPKKLKELLDSTCIKAALFINVAFEWLAFVFCKEEVVSETGSAADSHAHWVPSVPTD
jgi:hypothetical protein